MARKELNVDVRCPNCGEVGLTAFVSRSDGYIRTEHDECGHHEKKIIDYGDGFILGRSPDE